MTVAQRRRNQPARSGWWHWLRNWAASAEELEAAQLQEASAVAGCQPIDTVRPGERDRLSGRLVSVTSSPRESAPVVAAELFDGTGTVTLLWLGRRRIVGIEPGRLVTVRGRIAKHDDRRVIYNPEYTLELVE